MSVASISAFLIFIGYRLYHIYYNDKGCLEDFMFDKSHKYLWLFDSTKIEGVKCVYPLGNPKGEKYRFVYTYKKQYRYIILEDKNLNSVALNNIKDTVGSVTSGIYISPSEGNKLGWGQPIDFSSKICIDPSNHLLLNFDADGKLKKTISSNRISFSGSFTTLLIQNENKNSQYVAKFSKPTQTTLLFYKPKDVLYVIIINSFSGQLDYNDAMGKMILN